MKEIINELKEKSEHELYQVGMTPHIKGESQYKHDIKHTEKAQQYEKAFEILSSKYQVRDWLVCEVYEFEDYESAKVKYNEIISLSKGHEHDVQLLIIVEESTEL